MLYKKTLDVKVKCEASHHISESARDIVEKALSDRGQRPNLPKPANVERKANRVRQKMRPKDPASLDFEVDSEFLGCHDFLIGDLRVDRERHMIFATQQQLQLLRQTKHWFMDGTFKIVHAPFRGGQLMSTHGFVQRDGKDEQIPLVFVLMSRRRRDDYVAVLMKLLEVLGKVAVEGFVLDFEAAAWLAVREVCPGVQVKGCVFHWTQAVWRHVQVLGLKPSYSERTGIHRCIRQLLALPFLPANHIREAFEQLAGRANSILLKQLVSLIESTWMDHSIFEIASWSIFQHHIRTNNDTEGWQHRLNARAGNRGLTFYRLVPVLRKEADVAVLNVQLLVECGLGRTRRKGYRNLDDKIDTLWMEYAEHKLSTAELLRACSRLYGPSD